MLLGRKFIYYFIVITFFTAASKAKEIFVKLSLLSFTFEVLLSTPRVPYLAALCSWFSFSTLNSTQNFLHVYVVHWFLRVCSWFTSHLFLFGFCSLYHGSLHLAFSKVNGLCTSPNCALQKMCQKIAEKYIKYLTNKCYLIK